jgi:hypothetical protein
VLDQPKLASIAFRGDARQCKDEVQFCGTARATRVGRDRRAFVTSFRLREDGAMRVLFTATSGWGHIHPMVPLARALVDRGDEVLWATGADVCPRLEREGFHTAVAGLGEREAMAAFYERFPEVKSLPPPQWSDFMFPRLFGRVRSAAMLADLAPVVKKWSPGLPGGSSQNIYISVKTEAVRVGRSFSARGGLVAYFA